jgi:hypothetical protein
VSKEFFVSGDEQLVGSPRPGMAAGDVAESASIDASIGGSIRQQAVPISISVATASLSSATSSALNSMSVSSRASY